MECERAGDKGEKGQGEKAAPRREDAGNGAFHRAIPAPGAAKGSGKHPFRRWISENIYYLLAGAIFASLVLGATGFWLQDKITGTPSNIFDHLYRSIQLFVLEYGGADLPNNIPLGVARFLSPFLAAYTALRVFYDQIRQILARFTYNGHTIICGLGETGFLLARSLLTAGQRVVAIEADAESDYLGPLRQMGGIAIVGRADEPSTLCRARVGHAATLVAVCGNDGLNVKIASEVAKITHPKNNPSTAERVRGRLVTFLPKPVVNLLHLNARPGLILYAHTIDRRLCHYLTGQAFNRYSRGDFQLEFFNLYESAARQLLKAEPWAQPAYTEEEPPHLLIVGMGPMGQSLVRRAEHLWRRQNPPSGQKLQLSWIDPQAEKHRDLLVAEIPTLMKTCDLNPCTASPEASTFSGAWPPFEDIEMGKVSKVFVCLEDDTACLATAFILRQCSRSLNIPIVVCLSQYGGLNEILAAPGNEAGQPPSGLTGFSLLDLVCNPEQLRIGVYEDLAIAIHEDYRRNYSTSENSHEMRFQPWDRLDEATRDQNREAARSIGLFLGMLGYGIEPVDARGSGLTCLDDDLVAKLAPLEHARWKKQKEKAGVKLGPRSPDKNPNLYEWDDPMLKEAERVKTRAGVSKWPALLAAVDLQIYRRV